MGPLLPLMFLGAGIWYLDKDQKPTTKPPIPRYSRMAVSAVTETENEVRRFKALDFDFAAFGIEYVQVDSPSAEGMAMFRLVPLDIGAENAQKAIERATSLGNVVLGSLSLALSEPGSEPMLLLVVPVEKRGLASPSSQFAVLAEPKPVERVEPEVRPAPPVTEAAPAEVLERPKRNGLKKLPPEPVPEVVEAKVEA